MSYHNVRDEAYHAICNKTAVTEENITSTERTT